MVLPVAREPKVSTAQRPGTVRPIMREAVCSKQAVKIRLLEGPHPRAFAAACIAYLIYLHWAKISWFCMPWENIAFLWRTFFAAQNMQICPDWGIEPSSQVLSSSPSLKKTVIASFIITRMLLIHVTVSMIMILIWSRKDSYKDRLCETRQPANGQVIVTWSNLEPLLESSHILPTRHSRTRVVLREEWGLKSLYEAVVVHSNAFYFWEV